MRPRTIGFRPGPEACAPRRTFAAGNPGGTLSEDAPLTDLLHAWSAGDAAAREALLPRVYDELRRRPGAHLRRERPGHTLQATALVHEVYFGGLSIEETASVLALSPATVKRDWTLARAFLHQRLQG